MIAAPGLLSYLVRFGSGLPQHSEAWGINRDLPHGIEEMEVFHGVKNIPWAKA